MIRSLKIKGYKSFSDEVIELKPLTILTGLNGSGKSTVIQSLRMLFESSSINPYLEGLGDYSEIKSKYSPRNEPITFTATDENGHSCNLMLAENDFKVERHFEVLTEYVSAERLGPQPNLPICANRHVTIGTKGEYCADFFNKFSGSIIHEKLRHSSTVSNTLESQLDAWMSEISPNITFDFNVDRKHDSSTIEIDKHRATNTGYGISYALPIVISSLVLSSSECINIEQEHAMVWYRKLKSSGALFMVENPEAHLHPLGQTQLGFMLALLSSCGVQVILETHSDHVIDGVRIAVKEIESLNHDDVTIKFFSRGKDLPSEYRSISLLPNGTLDQWPSGFFDQLQNNLRRLSKRS